jgi:hypothetical protein
MGDDSGKRAFVFRLGHRLTSSLKNDILGLGWCLAEHLDKEKDWQKFKEIVRAAYPEEYSTGERALGECRWKPLEVYLRHESGRLCCSAF